MNKDEAFEQLPLLSADKIGDWIIDQKNSGTAEHPIQMPFVNYSELVRSFIDDVYTFEENNKDMGLTRYSDILKENEIEWGMVSMKDADTSSLNPLCIIALIMGAVRAERFCDGALLDFFKSGCILRWLDKLKGFDTESRITDLSK